jgi:hypothetical protein
MARAGRRKIDVARRLHIDETTLNKYYATLYSDARNDELTEIGESIFQRAKVSDTLASLVAKTQLGWSEKNKLEVENRNNNVNISVTMTPKEALDAYLQTLQNATRGPPRVEDE